MNAGTPVAPGPASRTARDTDTRAPLVRVQGLEKTYVTARGPLTLFKNLDLEVFPGELVAIVGQSGAGKSTLLHILGALDTPTAGTVHCASTNVAELTPRQAAAFRNATIGYVWQFHYLLPEFTALENVAMPLLARGQYSPRGPGSGIQLVEGGRLAGSRRSPARRALRRRAATHRAGPRSGGQSAPVAGRRAYRRPRRDPPPAASSISLSGLHVSHGLTSILVTHNLDLAARCTRTLRLEGGRLAAWGQPLQRFTRIPQRS